jgi:hypothetical protein
VIVTAMTDVSPATGVTVIVRDEPLPPSWMLPLGIVAWSLEVAVTESVAGSDSASPT